MSDVNRSSHLLRCIGVGALMLAVAACTPRLDTRGNLPDPERLAEIAPGQQTRQEVAEILGSPSSIAAFEEETWYYVSEKTETTAFFAPEVTDRQVVVLRFDKAGVVSHVEKFGLEKGRTFEPVDRETPTAGNEITILQQLFGNFGRFTKE